MAFDPTRLTPAPWKHEGGLVVDCVGFPILLPEKDSADQADDLTFAALARNAFDVMLRRGWTAYPVLDGWCVLDRSKTVLWANNEPYNAADPFSALVEADRWLSEQEKTN